MKLELNYSLHQFQMKNQCLSFNSVLIVVFKLVGDSERVEGLFEVRAPSQKGPVRDLSRFIHFLILLLF
jgi:hypothetical protein